MRALFISLFYLFENIGWAQGGIGALLNQEGNRLFPQLIVAPRHAGKPDLRWKIFDWSFVDLHITQVNYHLYYYPEEEWTAEFTIPLINNQIVELIHIFNYIPEKTFSYVLFASERDFQQANVFDVTEGVQGITSTTEATMAIPYWGEINSFNHVSTHELVHQFQVQKVNSISGSGSKAGLSLAPLWYIEGMAEYYSLKGMDDQSRMYIRDLLLYPNLKTNYEMPKFFSEKDSNFIDIYKVGQAKIDFLEKSQKNITQNVLFNLAAVEAIEKNSFALIVSKLMNLNSDQIEEKWKNYLDTEYLPEANRLSQSMNIFPLVEGLGENLDNFSISPSGDLLAVREIDTISRLTSLKIINLKDDLNSIKVVSDHQKDALSLYFMQGATFSITDKYIVYIAESVLGPQLFIREITRSNSNSNSNSKLKLERERVIKLFDIGLNQADSPAISPDDKLLAFVGVDGKGNQNVYLLTLDSLGGPPSIKQLTKGYYSWRAHVWDSKGILLSSDATEEKKYNIFRLSPESGELNRLTYSVADQLSPEPIHEGFLYQSLKGGSPQIYRHERGGDDIQLTEAKTELIFPRYRNDEIYSIGFKSGKFHLYHFPLKMALQNKAPKDISGNLGPPWNAKLISLSTFLNSSYHPFVSTAPRIDYFIGSYASGGYFGLATGMSDLMRNYNVSAELLSYGSFSQSNGYLFFSSNSGRMKWTLGIYQIVQPKLDNIFTPLDLVFRTYYRREFGGLGVLEYPIGPFSHFNAELRLGGINRNDFSDPILRDTWNTLSPGLEPFISPVFRLGYDSILYELFTGPLRGTSLLLESDTTFFTRRGAVTERARFDASYYLDFLPRTVFSFESVLGASWGDSFSYPFLVSSDDILRAYSFGDGRLYGNYLIAGKLELRFPIGSAFHFEPLRGLAATDLGSVYTSFDSLGSGITASYSLGVSLNIPPISFQLVNTHPVRTALEPPFNNLWHFSLRYLYS